MWTERQSERERVEHETRTANVGHTMDDLWTKSWQTWQHASQGLGLVLGLSLHLWPRPLTLTFDLWPDWWSIWTKSDGKIDTRPQQKPFGHTMSACTQKIDLCIDETGTGTNTMVEYEPKNRQSGHTMDDLVTKSRKNWQHASLVLGLGFDLWPWTVTLALTFDLDIWPWPLTLDKTKQDKTQEETQDTRQDLT